MTATRLAALAGISLASLSLLVIDGKAASAATFDFSSASSINSSSVSKSVGGFTLTAFDSNSIGNNPNTINTNPLGLCAWAAVGTSGFGRCGYGNSPGNRISAFKLSFNEPAVLQSFRIRQFDPVATSEGTVAFSLDNVTFSEFDFTNNGIVATNFSVGANQPIFVKTSATFTPANTTNTGIYRIDDFEAQSVPGPLPILGAAAAFGWSRKLKRKLSVKS